MHEPQSDCPIGFKPGHAKPAALLSPRCVIPLTSFGATIGGSAADCRYGIATARRRQHEAAKNGAGRQNRRRAKGREPRKAGRQSQTSRKPKAKAARKIGDSKAARGKKPAMKPLPAAAKAPPLPRIEPFTLSAPRPRHLRRSHEGRGSAPVAARAIAAAERAARRPSCTRSSSGPTCASPAITSAFPSAPPSSPTIPAGPACRRSNAAPRKRWMNPSPSPCRRYWSAGSASHPPPTASGRAAYARALQVMGNDEEANQGRPRSLAHGHLRSRQRARLPRRCSAPA